MLSMLVALSTGGVAASAAFNFTLQAEWREAGIALGHDAAHQKFFAKQYVVSPSRSLCLVLRSHRMVDALTSEGHAA